ncbi:MAG: hypothetical protein ACE5H1_10930, partial [Thermodesulfobacteriota bacterium]
MTNKGFLTKSKDKSLIFMELQKRDFETLWKHGLKKNVCPVCSVPDHKQEFEKYGLRYVRCISCNVVYPLEYFKDIDLLDYYRNGESINYFMEEILEPSIERRKRVIYPQRIELIEKFKKRGK